MEITIKVNEISGQPSDTVLEVNQILEDNYAAITRAIEKGKSRMFFHGETCNIDIIIKQDPKQLSIKM